MSPAIRPLVGAGVGVTRPGQDAGRLGQRLRDDGAEVFHWPSIRFGAPPDPEALRAALCDGDADWLILSSPRAARCWLDAVEGAGHGPSVRARHPRIAAVGTATTTVLEQAGWAVDLVPATSSGRGLVQAFAESGEAAHARVLLPRSDLADETVPDGLRRLGADVRTAIAYRTLPSPPNSAEVLSLVDSNRLHAIVFSSPSTVRGFLAAFDATERSRVRESVAPVAYGPTTAAALAASGWDSTVARRPSPTAVVASVIEALGSAGAVRSRDR